MKINNIDVEIEKQNGEYICTWKQDVDATLNGDEIIVVNCPCKRIISEKDIVKYLLKEKIKVL